MFKSPFREGIWHLGYNPDSPAPESGWRAPYNNLANHRQSFAVCASLQTIDGWNVVDTKHLWCKNPPAYQFLTLLFPLFRADLRQEVRPRSWFLISRSVCQIELLQMRATRVIGENTAVEGRERRLVSQV